ncbi:hypothetical protein GJAV_G00078790 [Gymnothorax javanicus]|nr:hypothetical protein GJAV_G00078790 [Gymnothorax javanicus]
MSTPSPAPAPLRHHQPSQSPFELHPHESAIPVDGTSSGMPIQRLSPEKVRPYPKAGSRNENKRQKEVNRNTDRHPSKSCFGGGESAEGPGEKHSSSKCPKKMFSGHTATTVSQGNDEECLVCGEIFASSLLGEVWVR